MIFWRIILGNCFFERWEGQFAEKFLIQYVVAAQKSSSLLVYLISIETLIMHEIALVGDDNLSWTNKQLANDELFTDYPPDTKCRMKTKRFHSKMMIYLCPFDIHNMFLFKVFHLLHFLLSECFKTHWNNVKENFLLCLDSDYNNLENDNHEFSSIGFISFVLETIFRGIQ